MDTRLAVLAAVGDKPGKTILTLHEAVVGEQVYPNLPLAAGDYYLEVSGDGRNLDVPYVAEVQRLAPLGPGDEREPDDDAAGATPLEIDRPVTGYLATAGDADFFSLKVTQDTYLAIVLGAIPGVDPSVRIKDSRGNSQIVDVNTGGVGEPDEAELVKLPAGEYRLVVQARAESPKANARAPYRLEVRRAAAQAGFEEEPDNAPDQANRLPLGGSLRGRLDPADDQDWYSFHLDRPSLVRIGVTGMDGVAYQVWLENPGYPLPLGRTGADASVTNWPLDKGDHCFGLAARTTRAVDRRQSYRVRVEVVAEPDNGYSVRNNSFETATDITPDDTLRSALYPWEDADFYRVTFKERDLVYRLRPIQLSLNRLGVQIHDERRTLLKIVAGSTLENWTPAPGRYTLRVYRLDGGNHQEDYSFRIQEERLSTPEEEREFNDSRQTATGLAEETLMHGQLSPMGAGLRDEDWYRIDPKDGAGKLYAIEAAPGGKQLDLAMALEDADGKPVLPARNQRGAGEPERLENWGPKPGSYFLHVWCPVDQNRNAPYTVRWRETGRRSADMEFEPNDAVDQANDLKLDVVVQGRLTTPEDGDVFRVTGTRPDAQIVRVKLTGADNLHRVTILDSTGAVISSEAMPHGGSMEFTGFVLSRGQSLFVKVGCNSYQYRAASADYSVVATEVGPWKEGLEAEPNFDLARAGKLSVDRDMVGQMWPEGDQDLFVWEVPEKDPGPYTLSISPPDQNLCIDLAHSKDGKEWAPLASVRGKLALPNIRARAGRYRVTLSSHGFSATPYTIRVSRQPGPDPGRDLEFNNSPDWAVPLDTGTPLRGLTAYDGDVDCLLARGSGPTPLRLKIKVDDKSGLEAIVSRREGKELREVKRLGLDRGEEATVERWVTGDRDSVIAVKGYWSEQPTYEVSLLPSTASVTADAEPNDQFADALTLVPGREIAGSIDHRCDRDVYRLDVTSPDGQPFTLAYAGPTRCETRVSLRTWDEQNKREVDTHTVTVQAGKTLKLDDLLLTRGTWYVAIDGAVAKAAYQLRIDAAKAPSSDRIYAPSHHGANPREALLDRPLHGQFLPFGHERWEGVRLTLDRPRSLGVHLAVPKACDGWLVLFDAQGRELRSWSLEPEGRDESAYLPTLEAGSYVIEVRGRAREETGYALTVKTGAPGYFFPEKSRSPELNVAFRDNGGHIVRATSTYGSDWAPESLLDGSVESRGWCSKDSTLPQEVVIGFAGDRIARIGSIRVNPRTADPPEHWAKTVELLVLATGKGDDWQSVGTLTLHREDRDVVVDFPPREAKQVMVRVKASNGGQYTQLGEVSVMEAVPGFQSCLRGDHAIPLGSSDFAGGMNVLSSVLGGKIESVSAEYDGTWNAGRLLDGWPADPGWLTPDAASPAEVVASIGGAPVEIDRVILSGRGHDWRDVAKDVKLWVAESKERGFREVASFRMQPWSLWQTLAFRPVKARFVKLRILSGYGGGYFYLGELGAIGR
ncbi:MAG: discoidin domain-containing protein [Candidatus Riflebacteria bacterium]|nr:discoidin domain-containing protein [Candidatus Riflebacteria bacterium]